MNRFSDASSFEIFSNHKHQQGDYCKYAIKRYYLKLVIAAWIPKTRFVLLGGITSGWFCLESTLLALAIAGTATSFYVHRTTETARRMFHASLLYLPVFMSGIMFHRLSDNKEHVSVKTSEALVGYTSTSEASVKEFGNSDQEKVKHLNPSGRQRRPPVAFASVAPFPFLPAPTYSSYWFVSLSIYTPVISVTNWQSTVVSSPLVWQHFLGIFLLYRLFFSSLNFLSQRV